MASLINGRKPFSEVQNQGNLKKSDEEMTVEEFLEQQCEEIIQAFKLQTQELVSKLRQQYEDGKSSTLQSMSSSLKPTANLCVVLKCIAGSHIGQRFRLEASNVDSDDVFKMGRSTGKLFKEKGVSLYKDKEISTTHAKVELRNGQAFFVDMRSTNGSQLNGSDVDALVPYRLQHGDVITMGSTELRVQIAEDDADNEEEEANENEIGGGSVASV